MTSAKAKRYVTLNLPIPIAKRIDEIVHQKGSMYRSRSEFCIQTIRTRVEHIKNNGNDNKKNNISQ